MLSRQQTMLNTLKINFENITIKENCHRTSTTKIKEGMANRAFDDFPTLLSEDELDYVVKKFSLIYNNIHRIKETKDGIYLIDDCDISATKTWIQEIAQKAHHELFDHDIQIKDDIIQLLEWENVKQLINCSDLVFAYVFAVNQSVMIKMQNEIKNNMSPYLAICGHINTHSRAWIDDAMKILTLEEDVTPSNSDSEDDSNSPSYFHEFAQLNLDSPELVAGIGLGSLFLAGLFLFGNNYSRRNRNAPTNDDQHTTKPGLNKK